MFGGNLALVGVAVLVLLIIFYIWYSTAEGYIQYCTDKCDGNKKCLDSCDYCTGFCKTYTTQPNLYSKNPHADCLAKCHSQKGGAWLKP